MKKLFISGCALAGLLIFNSCSTNPVTGKREVVLMSEAQELALGQQSDPEIIAQFGLYQNEAMQRFINEKGQQMAAVSHRSNIKYTFKVVDSPVINAFALPGGYVYFTRGIMAHFNNEAQFAGVLGHEIGHVTARHSVQQQSKSILAQVGLIAGMIIAPDLAQFGNMASQGMALLFLKFGRDDERESDRLGVEYSTKTGYDAKQMADFFLTLQRSSSGSGAAEIPDFLSTHPNPEDRYQTVQQLASEWKQKTNSSNLKVNRESYLKLIDGIVYGEDPKEGFVENQFFYHPVMKFQFPVPAAWAYQNSPQQFQMAPKDGKAIMVLSLAAGNSLEAAAQDMVQKNKLQVVESGKVTVNGLPALAVVADQVPDPQQQEQAEPLRTLTYLIQYNNSIYRMMGISRAADFNAYAPAFTNTMKSFKPLTEPDKLNRQPEKVRVKTIGQNTTLAAALRSYQVPEKRLEEMAILNGMTLSDPLSKGTLIKVIEK